MSTSEIGLSAELTATYATWGRRAGGFVIDAVIAYLPSLIGGLIYEATVDASGRPSTFGRIVDLIGIAIALGVLVYNRWIRGGSTGKSWGRSIMRIRLVGKQTGRPIGPGRAFLRDLCHTVDSLVFLVGWLLPLWDAKRQTFADKIMKTVVRPAP